MSVGSRAEGGCFSLSPLARPGSYLVKWFLDSRKLKSNDKQERLGGPVFGVGLCPALQYTSFLRKASARSAVEASTAGT